MSMKTLLPTRLFAAAFAAPILLLPIGASALDDRFDAKAGSSIVFTKEKEGIVAVRVQNTRLVPYLFLEELGGSHYRLVTIATDMVLRTDREQVDNDAFVSVTIDDMGDTNSERISFKDRGEDGAVVAERYFSTTTPGCCGNPDTHHVRLLETGQHLFQSTGPGPVGITAWAEFPEARPFQIRWAAFGPVPSKAQNDGSVLGKITYGNDDGPLSTVVLSRPQRAYKDNLDLALTSGATLLWVDSKEKLSEMEILYHENPSSGTPDTPRAVWPPDNKEADPANVRGLVLALELDGKRLISIPVEGDKLVADKATIHQGLLLKLAP